MSALLPLLFVGCYRVVPSDGGGVPDPPAERSVDQEDVLVPEGYRVEVVARDLDLPTGVTLDDDGRPCITEAGYSYGELFRTPRLVCLEPDGTRDVVATGDNPPWNGVDFHDGSFYVAEGGVLEGGRILRITDGEVAVLAENLPSVGDHHTNGPVVHEGWVYFGQGTATNSGVVGPDNKDYGWLARHPDFHDRPCEDVTLAGHDYASDDLFGGEGTRYTGAFVPYGTRTEPGEVIAGQVPCSGAILRVPAAGGAVELVAWGLRNPFGLTVARDGGLLVTDNSYDVRGSRPIWGTADLLRRIEPGTWHGWPDYSGTRPVAIEPFAPPGDEPPAALLAEHPGDPPEPLAYLGVHGAAVGLEVAPEPFGGPDHVFVAMFGDMAPSVGKVMNPVGFRLLRVRLTDGEIETFAANVGDEVGPATWQGTRGLERPIDVAFSEEGEAMYLLDFGILGMGADPLPVPETGVLWRITSDPGIIAAKEAP